jgi:O-antigen polysaccharide polymerase Wzy
VEESQSLQRQLEAVHSRRPLLIAHAVITGLLIVLALAPSSFDLSSASLIYPLSVISLGVWVWCLWSWNRAGHSLLDPYGVFLVAVGLFNLGESFLFAVHLNQYPLLDNPTLGEVFPPSVSLAATYLGLLCLSALHLGALLAVSCGGGRQPRAKDRRSEAGDPDVLIAGWILLAISGAPAAVQFYSAIRTVLSHGYIGLYRQQLATGVSASPATLAALVVPAAYFLLVGGKASRRIVWLSAGLVTAYALIELFLGYRYYAIITVIAYCWLFSMYVRPLPRVLTAASALVTLLVIFPVIGSTRGVSGPARLNPGSWLRALTSVQNPLTSALSEMGSSMRVNAYVLQLVPRVRSFDWGTGYLWAASSAVPNLFWRVHPAIAHSYEGWFIRLIRPETAAGKGGLGFTFAAEAYANFGWVGTPAVALVVGFAFVSLLIWALQSSNQARIASAASYSVFFTVLAREESSVVIRPFLWYILPAYLLVVVLRQRRYHRALVDHGKVRRGVPAGPSPGAQSRPADGARQPLGA